MRSIHRGTKAKGVAGMKTILALDLGGKMGFAMQLPDGSIWHGMVQLSKHSRFEGGGVRYVRMADWLERNPKPDMVYFEMVHRHAGTAAAHAYGGYLATLAAHCERRGIPYEGVSVQAIKKHATGRGNGHKNAIMAAMQDKGFSVTDDNEADALALLLLKLSANGVTNDQT